MKLVRSSRGRLVFRLGAREKQLLFRVLGLYPLVPPAHHRLITEGKGAPGTEDQRLFEEAIAEQRQENRRQVVALLKKRRFRKTGRFLEFSLKTTEMESVLQVLNDVRIGAWIALGEPQELDRPAFNENNAPFFLAMDLAGYFQANLLAAMEGR